MFYIIKDGLFFAGYSYCGSGKMKERWDENLCFMIKNEEEAREVWKTVGGLLVTFGQPSLYIIPDSE